MQQNAPFLHHIDKTQKIHDMKKILFSALFCLLIGSLAAQETESRSRFMPPRNEFNISYGASLFLYNQNHFGCYEPYWGGSNWFGDDTHTGRVMYFGVPGIAYMHHHNTWFAQGAEFLMGGYYTNEYDNFTHERLEVDRYINYSFLYTARFTYMSREHCSLYGSASLGFMLRTYANAFDYGHLMGHLCPFGVSWGNANIRGFAEIGIGGKGLGRIGLSYSFGNK